jgi:hypothetical protein
MDTKRQVTDRLLSRLLLFATCIHDAGMSRQNHLDTRVCNATWDERERVRMDVDKDKDKVYVMSRAGA